MWFLTIFQQMSYKVSNIHQRITFFTVYQQLALFQIMSFFILVFLETVGTNIIIGLVFKYLNLVLLLFIFFYLIYLIWLDWLFIHRFSTVGELKIAIIALTPAVLRLFHSLFGFRKHIYGLNWRYFSWRIILTWLTHFRTIKLLIQLRISNASNAEFWLFNISLWMIKTSVHHGKYHFQ